LTVGLSFVLIYAKAENAEVCDLLRWSQRVIDLADGDPSKGNFIIGSKTILRRGLQLELANVLGTNPVRDVQQIKSKRPPKGAS
jgi:hypothetical protein